MNLRKKIIILSVKYCGDWFSMFKILQEDPMLKQISENDFTSYEKLLDGINVVTILDEQYPDYLKEEQTPPFVIYFKGDINLLNKKRVGVLTAKYLTDEGGRSCKKIFETMREDRVAIVYGQDIGCEKICDELMFLGGKIKILNNGIFDGYLDGERQLIEKNQPKLVLTEFPPTVKASRRTTSWSQRLVVFISDGLFCMELKKQTQYFRLVEQALNIGKIVYVLPGKYDSILLEGSFILVNKGAKCFFEKDEFIKTIKNN